MKVRLYKQWWLYQRTTNAEDSTFGALGFRFRQTRKDRGSEGQWVVKDLNPSVLGQIKKVFKYLRQVEILSTGEIVNEIGVLERLFESEARRESQGRDPASTSAGKSEASDTARVARQPLPSKGSPKKEGRK